MRSFSKKRKRLVRRGDSSNTDNVVDVNPKHLSFAQETCLQYINTNMHTSALHLILYENENDSLMVCLMEYNFTFSLVFPLLIRQHTSFK